jgi:hypothetical protein
MGEGIGAGGWVRLLAILLGAGIAILLVLVFITNSVIKYGVLGGVVVIGLVLAFGGWLYDRHQKKIERQWDEA